MSPAAHRRATHRGSALLGAPTRRGGRGGCRHTPGPGRSPRAIRRWAPGRFQCPLSRAAETEAPPPLGTQGASASGGSGPGRASRAAFSRAHWQAKAVWQLGTSRVTVPSLRSGQVSLLVRYYSMLSCQNLKPGESQGSLGYHRGMDEFESSYARIDRCDTAQPFK